MDAYLDLSRADRRVLCESARMALGLAAASIEKDFWCAGRCASSSRFPIGRRT